MRLFLIILSTSIFGSCTADLKSGNRSSTDKAPEVESVEEVEEVPVVEEEEKTAKDEETPLELSLDITGAPSGNNSVLTASIKVAGDAIDEFRWSLSDQSLDCDKSDFSEWVPAGTVSVEIGANGPKRFCAEGRPSGADYSTENSADWSKGNKNDFNLAELVNLSTDAPLFALRLDPDCLRKINDGVKGSRGASTLIANDGIMIVSMCLHDSTGRWFLAVGGWDGKASSGTWIDSNEGTPTYDGPMEYNSLTQNGATKIGNFAPPNLV
jgi:hypothetical protein